MVSGKPNLATPIYISLATPGCLTTSGFSRVGAGRSLNWAQCREQNDGSINKEERMNIQQSTHTHNTESMLVYPGVPCWRKYSPTASFLNFFLHYLAHRTIPLIQSFLPDNIDFLKMERVVNYVAQLSQQTSDPDVIHSRAHFKHFLPILSDLAQLSTCWPRHPQISIPSSECCLYNLPYFINYRLKTLQS